MNQDKRCADAQGWIKEAEKAIKHSFFSKPKREDWDTAAVLFDKAAGVYIHFKMKEEAKKYYTKSAHAHSKARNFLFAARAHENKATILKDEKKLLEAVDVLKEAGDMYLEDNKLDKQADMYTKAATMIQMDYPEKAVQLLEEATDRYADEGKWHICDKAFRTLTTILLKQHKYDEAQNTIRKQFPGHKSLGSSNGIIKGLAEITLIYLLKGDLEAANREVGEAMSKEPEFQYSDEGRAVEQLLAAYALGDPDDFNEAKKNTTFTFLHPAIARLVKALPTPDGPVEGKIPQPIADDVANDLDEPDPEDDLR